MSIEETSEFISHLLDRIYLKYNSKNFAINNDFLKNRVIICPEF